VKQQCESNQFIATNDKLEMDARVFISNKWNGGKSRTVERQKERECERQRQETVRENMWNKRVGLISEVIKMMPTMLFKFSIFSLSIY